MGKSTIRISAYVIEQALFGGHTSVCITRITEGEYGRGWKLEIEGADVPDAGEVVCIVTEKARTFKFEPVT